MALNIVSLPNEYFPFFNKSGPIFDAQIFIGQPDLDPEIPANQKTVTLRQESGDTVDVPQPIRTSSGGIPTYNGSPAQILVDGNYSIKVRDNQGRQIYYYANFFKGQPVTDEYLANYEGSLGPWSAGLVFNYDYNYAVYEGVKYQVKLGTPLPYTAQGADPTALPDSDFVEPFSDLNTVSGDRRYTATFKNDSYGSAVDNMIAGRIDGVENAVARKLNDRFNTGETEWVCNGGSSGTIDDFDAIGDVSPVDFGVRNDGTDGAPANHTLMQSALNMGFRSFDFGGDQNRFLFNGPWGLPDQSFYGENAYYLSANGAKVQIESTTALITSKTIADNGGVSTGGNTFSSKVFISGFNFVGTGENGVFDGDYIYNIHFTKNHCYKLKNVTTSYQEKPGGYPNGYFQSVFISDNTFIQCERIINGSRGFNITFNDNMCEGCIGGIYINGNLQPAVNNIRLRDNVFEGGGLFCSFGDALGGIIEGNYIEINRVGDVATKKCHIDLSYKGGSQFYDWRISRNTAQDPQDQIDDPEFQLVSFAGAPESTDYSSVLLEGNWTSSRVTNFTPIKNAIANRQADRQNKFNMPSTTQEARVDYIRSYEDRLVSTNLVSGEFRIATIEIPDGNAPDRDLILDLDVLMNGVTAGGVVTCTALAKISVLIAATGSGAGNQNPDHSVEAYLTAYTQQPNGTILDNISTPGSVLFSSPSIRTGRIGTKVYIILSNYQAQSVPNYGAVSSVRTFITAKACNLAFNNNTAARWITFTQ